MKKTVVINGKEHKVWEFERIVYWFCFANLIAQMIILYLNFTTFKNSMVTKAFLGGLQTVILPLTIILAVVSTHNSRIYRLVREMLNENLRLLEEERKKNVKKAPKNSSKNVKNVPKKPRKNVKETKDGTK